MRDVYDVAEDLSKRVRSLEQEVSGTVGHQAAMGANGILPEGTTVGGRPLAGDIDPPTNVAGVVGAWFDNVYIDLTFDEPTVGHAVAYEIEISEETAPAVYEFWKNVTVNSNAPRIEGLLPLTDYGVRVYAINAVGVRSDPTGYYDFTTTKDATVPDQAQGLILYSGLRSVMAVWDENLEFDVARGAGQYEFQLDTDPNFPTAETYYTTALIIAIDAVVANETYFGRVRALDRSGNEGPWSDYATVVAGQALAGDLTPGIIVTDHIATVGLDAAVVKFGQMVGDRIQANTLDVTSLKTSELVAADITLNGGSLRAGTPPVEGVVFNSQGLRSYKDSELVVVIDANGDALFNNVTITGTFQTAESGAKVRISSHTGGHSIEMFSGEPGETAPAQLYSAVWATDAALLTLDGAVVGVNDQRPGLLIAADGSVGATGRYFFTVDTEIFQINAMNYTGEAETPNASLKPFLAERFRMYTDAMFLTKTFGITHSTTLPPLQVGNQYVGADPKDNIAIGGRDIIGRTGVGENLLRLNHSATGSWGGVILGGTAFAGRYGATTDYSAQFSHSSWRGQSAGGFGMRHLVNGDLQLAGWGAVLIKNFNRDITINNAAVQIHSSEIDFPTLSYSSAGGGNFIASYDTSWGNGVLRRYSSSIKGKKHVLDLQMDPSTPDSTLLLQLRPRSYESALEGDWAMHGQGRRYVGLIAEEAAAVHPHLAVLDQNEAVVNVDWVPIWTMLIAEVQRLHHEIEGLKNGSN